MLPGLIANLNSVSSNSCSRKANQSTKPGNGTVHGYSMFAHSLELPAQPFKIKALLLKSISKNMYSSVQYAAEQPCRVDHKVYSKQLWSNHLPIVNVWVILQPHNFLSLHQMMWF